MQNSRTLRSFFTVLVVAQMECCVTREICFVLFLKVMVAMVQCVLTPKWKQLLSKYSRFLLRHYSWVFASSKTERIWILKVLSGKFYQLSSGLQTGAESSGERDHGLRAAGVPEVKGWLEIPGVISSRALKSVFVLGLMTAEIILWLGVF